MKYNDNMQGNDHESSMRQFDRQFNETKQEVYKKTNERSKKSRRYALAAAGIALLVIALFLALFVEPVSKSMNKKKISSEHDQISQKIYEYLDACDYRGLSDYSDSMELLDNETYSEEYSVLMGARYYKWATGFMSDSYNGKKLTDSDVAYVSSYLEEFYYYTQMSAYTDNASTQTERNSLYLEKMRSDMSVLLKEIYRLTDADTSIICTYSSAQISRCLIERSGIQ